MKSMLTECFGKIARKCVTVLGAYIKNNLRKRNVVLQNKCERECFSEVGS